MNASAKAPLSAKSMPTRRPPAPYGGFEPELITVKALLHQPAAVERIADHLRADDFALVWCRAVVSEVLRLHRAGQPVTVEAVHRGLLASGEHSCDDDITNLALADVTVPCDDYEAFASLVTDRGRRHRLAMRLAAARSWLDVGGDPEAITRTLIDQLTAEVASWA